MNLIRLSLFNDDELLLFIDGIIRVDALFIVDLFDDVSLLLVLLSPLVFGIDIIRLVLLVMVSSGSTVPLSIYSENNN